VRVKDLLLSPLPAFLLVSLLLFAWHEPWRDEAQPWLVARDAPNLFHELDSETHPGLWYVLAFPLAKAGLPFDSLRALNLVISLGALALLALRGPFSRAEAWLYAFGYFVVYEYGTLARNYALVVLLLYLVAVTWRSRFEKPWAHGALLLLLANAHALATLLTLVLGAAYAIEWALREKSRGAKPLVAPALAALGAPLVLAQLWPAPDLAAWRTGATTSFDLGSLRWTCAALIQALLPVPSARGWSWGATWLDSALPPALIILVGAALWGLATWSFARRPRALLLWIGGSLALLAAFHLKSTTASQARHHGLLFVWLVFCVWTARLDAPRPAPPTPRSRRAKAGVVALAVLLSLHVANALPAAYHDAKEDFSGGPATARFLVAHGYADDRTLIAVYPSFIAAPILAQMPPTKTQTWFLQVREYGSYTRFTTADAESFDDDMGAMLRDLDAEAARTQPAHLLVILSHEEPTRSDLRLLDWHSGLAPGDWMYVYERDVPPPR